MNALVGSNRRRHARGFRRRLVQARSTTRNRDRTPDSGGMSFEIPGMPGAAVGMVNLGDIFGKAMGGRTKTRRMTVAASHELLVAEEADKLLDNEAIIRDAIDNVENNGIVFLDEIDKITARSDVRVGGDVSREGVQRDLLPLIEGTTVSTKHGPVKTDHVLFIASGAFTRRNLDLLPERRAVSPSGGAECAYARLLSAS